MEIEGRKQAKEQLRLDEYNLNVTRGARIRKMYVNARRNQSEVEDSAPSQDFQDQRDVPKLQESLRVGLCSEGENSYMGGGRGSPASLNCDDFIHEQPRVFKPTCKTDAGTGVL